MRAGFRLKVFLASVFDALHVNQILHQIQVQTSSPFIRAINYHDVPSHESARFESQLRYYCEHFSPVSLDDLLAFQNGIWTADKPGLILSFDDGFRSSYEIAAPLLDEYGFTGWFFISPGFLDIPIQQQREKARDATLVSRQYAKNDERVFLTWDQVKELDKRHVIGCHTLTHRRLRSGLSAQTLHQEIVHSKEILEHQLGHEVPVFAWVGGEEASYSHQAARIIEEAGFRVAFLTNNSLIRPGQDLLSLDRTNVESSFPLPLVRFQLSGAMDLLYSRKRSRVARTLSSQD